MDTDFLKLLANDPAPLLMAFAQPAKAHGTGNLRQLHKGFRLQSQTAGGWDLALRNVRIENKRFSRKGEGRFTEKE